MKKPTSRSTLLFILLVTLVPAALVYLAAKVHAERQLQQHEERISQEGKDAIAHVVKLNELRLTMPGKPPQEITALVIPSAAPPLHLDLHSSAAETPPAAQPVK